MIICKGAALGRHLAKWWNRQETDPESGINHLAHVATTAFLLHCALNNKKYAEFDDRPEKGERKLA